LTAKVAKSISESISENSYRTRNRKSTDVSKSDPGLHSVRPSRFHAGIVTVTFHTYFLQYDNIQSFTNG